MMDLVEEQELEIGTRQDGEQSVVDQAGNGPLDQKGYHLK